ncbi:MerR family transcriptional regulator [Anaerocolumna xylanovorans]|uniref:DNA-binding transcriptional regulator, MerR family n=1 Tax=Anaerocolumna xylanovorans DSM 12503 TaxID=1121345 RepID=A0A1M7Y5B5_9FIRM|nr:MerR family transcriptional regulator [Anaerocolumna xylanovorans]SHO47634.1 DNA-binding transcriptional regulator, MerR family [Anaerocolumna xylanovorans DSM 12503]
MLIKQAGKAAGLTKKAIEYYTEQGLTAPSVLENGYRDYSEEDINKLKKISVLRKLGLGMEEIKEVLEDKTETALKRLTVQKELLVQREQEKKKILDRLSCGGDYSKISEDLKAMEENCNIAERLLEAFPGYYGRFTCLHFARFLKEPALTKEQQEAYQVILSFLDDIPSFEFPEDLKQYFENELSEMGTEAIDKMLGEMKNSVENIEEFLTEKKDFIGEYVSFRKSEAYLESPAYKMTGLMKDFNNTSGYYTVFIPAMEKLSPSYKQYRKELEKANERLLTLFPEAADLK